MHATAHTSGDRDARNAWSSHTAAEIALPQNHKYQSSPAPHPTPPGRICPSRRTPTCPSRPLPHEGHFQSLGQCLHAWEQAHSSMFQRPPKPAQPPPRTSPQLPTAQKQFFCHRQVKKRPGKRLLSRARSYRWKNPNWILECQDFLKTAGCQKDRSWEWIHCLLKVKILSATLPLLSKNSIQMVLGKGGGKFFRRANFIN